MSILQEFKEFAIKGNVVDLAVGLILGGAFGKIVSSLVDDVIMPPIGLIIGGVDFSDLRITLKAATDAAPAVTIKYGQFVQTAFNFTIIAFSVFLLVKAINTLKRKLEVEKQAEAAALSKSESLLVEIRDLLKAKQS